MYTRPISTQPLRSVLRRAALGVLLGSMIGGCSLAPQALEADRIAPLPARFDTVATGLIGAAQEATETKHDQEIRDEGALAPSTRSIDWWTSFEDPVLDRLVDPVLVRNLDLHVADARLREVQQRYRIARAEQFPTVSRNMEASRQSIPSNTGSTGSISQSVPTFPDRIVRIGVLVQPVWHP